MSSLKDQYLAEAEKELGARREARALCGHTVMYFAREDRGHNEIVKSPCGVCQLKLQLLAIKGRENNGTCETHGSPLLKDQDGVVWCFDCERAELARLREGETRRSEQASKAAGARLNPGRKPADLPSAAKLRRELERGKTQAELAEKYGVSQATISRKLSE